MAPELGAPATLASAWARGASRMKNTDSPLMARNDRSVPDSGARGLPGSCQLVIATPCVFAIPHPSGNAGLSAYIWEAITVNAERGA
jgi:hypothetical protein